MILIMVVHIWIAPIHPQSVKHPPSLVKHTT